MPLSNCIVHLKVKWTSQCISSANGNANTGADPNTIVFTTRENFYDQPIDSGIKQYKEIRKLTTEQGEYYNTGCLLGCEFIKNHYRLTAVDLGLQNELDTDSKAIQLIQSVGQLKKLDGNDNATDAGFNQSMFVLTIQEKIKEATLKFSQGSATVL